jgi:hypothetical protein
MRIVFGALLLGAAAGLAACGNSAAFSGRRLPVGAADATAASLPSAPPTTAATAGDPSPDATDGGPGADEVTTTDAPSPTASPSSPQAGEPTPPPTGCPRKAQAILVLDFKSGWWSGDGGDFFRTVVADLASPCIGAVRFEYHHMIAGSNTVQLVPSTAAPSTMSSTNADAATALTDWSGYTQIWVLSGSLSDPEDLATTSPFFQRLVAKIKSAKAALFVASGNGNINHANAVLTGLDSPARFATDLPEGPVVDATGAFAVKTQLTRGAELQDHALFQRGVQSIADIVETAGDGIFTTSERMQSDYLDVGTAGKLKAVGRSAAGKPVIAVLAGDAPRRTVFDAGLQRFYAIRRPDAPGQTKIYLQNIIVYLGE